MKLKIRNTTDGLKYASCYIGATLAGHDSDRLLIGVDGRYKYPFYMTDLCQYDEITLDTEANQPCIYACMKQGMKVEIYGEEYDFSNPNEDDVLRLINNYYLNKIKSIRILGEFEGVEVEE